MTEDISKSSPEYMFGEIITEIKSLKQGAAELTDAVKNLPEKNPVCKERVIRMEALEVWRDTHDDEERFHQQSGLKLWHGIILVGATALASGLVTLAVNAATK